MGSTLSKVVWAHKGTAASFTAPVTQTESCQELRFPNTNDEHEGPLLASSRTPHIPIAPLSSSPANEMDKPGVPPQQSANSASDSAAETLQELPGQVLDSEPNNQEPRPQTPPSPINSEVSEPRLKCLICGEPFARNEEHKALKPCYRCKNPYCSDCLKGMFIGACTDTSRMPPKCCAPIPLHLAKPYMAQDEISLFRAKYEEWDTSNPFYCPVATCSAFIPERLLPSKKLNRKGELHIDSGTGALLSAVVTCPQCNISICSTCRSLAHDNAPCESSEFGSTDRETAELLKLWGYKQCPKCSNGLKRMFGCSHMQCRCGAHFCWMCMRNPDYCGGDCEDEDSDDHGSEYESEREDDEEQPQPGDSTDADKPTEVRIRNLDGGPSRYWYNQDLDFGDEPVDNGEGQSWDCHHSFVTVKAGKANTPSTEGMECMKCWAPITPAEERPELTAAGTKDVLRPGTLGFGGSIPNPLSSSHPLNKAQGNILSQSAPAKGAEVIDIHGNIGQATESPASPRRASTGDFANDGLQSHFNNPSRRQMPPPSTRRYSRWDLGPNDIPSQSRSDLATSSNPNQSRWDTPLPPTPDIATSRKRGTPPSPSLDFPVRSRPWQSHWGMPLPPALDSATSSEPVTSPWDTPLPSGSDSTTSSMSPSVASQCDDCEILVCITCKDKLEAALHDD